MKTEKNITKGNVPERTHTERHVAPATDIFENQDEILLLADMPGVAVEQLEVRVDKDVLILEGKKSMEDSTGILRCELEACTYTRQFSLPRTIDPAKISASLEHGVLRVHLPKRESIKPRQVQVTAG